MQRKSRLLSVMNSFKMSALLLSERMFSRASLRECCCGICCEERGSGRRLELDRFECFDGGLFLLTELNQLGQRGLTEMMG